MGDEDAAHGPGSPPSNLSRPRVPKSTCLRLGVALPVLIDHPRPRPRPLPTPRPHRRRVRDCVHRPRPLLSPRRRPTRTAAHVAGRACAHSPISPARHCR